MKISYILFVFLLIENTTQRQDVAFFKSKKVVWRNMLAAWKTSTQGNREAIVQKSSFRFTA